MKIRLLLTCFITCFYVGTCEAYCSSDELQSLYNTLESNVDNACRACQDLAYAPSFDAIERSKVCKAQVGLYIADVMMKYPELSECGSLSCK